MDEDVLDVLIVGAGLAGTTAAYTLLHEHHVERLHLVEADTVVGGRTRNWDTGDHAIELGGTWVSPNHTALLDLCHTLDIPVFRASWVEEEGVSKIADDVKTNHDESTEHYFPWWFWGSDFELNEYGKQGYTIFHSASGTFTFDTPATLLQSMDPQVLAELQAAGDFIQEMTDTTLPDLCWDAEQPGVGWEHWDAYTTAAAVFPKLSFPESRNIIRAVIHDKNAQEPSSVGFLFNLISFRGCNSKGPDTEYRIRGGSQAVAQALADRLGADRLTLGDAVQSVVASKSLDKGDSIITVTLQSGRILRAKTVIVTGSPPVVLGIRFDPPLPQVHAQLLQRMPMGTSRKVIAIYPTPWWRDSYNLSGDILASSLPPHLCVPGNEDGQPIFGQCFDTTPYSHAYGALTCFVEGRANLFFSSLDEAEQESLLMAFLEHSFAHLVDGKEWKPDRILQYNWADNPHVRGAYTAYMPTGVLSVPPFWQAFCTMEKIPNVWLAGSEYHVGYGCGYMDGAVRSGKRAAGMVVDRLEEMRMSFDS